MPDEPSDYFYNAHVHLFTYKHVPRRFTRRMKPAIISFLNLKFAINIYRFFTPRHNEQLRKFNKLVRSTYYQTMEVLSYVWLDKVVFLIRGLLGWVFKMILGILQLDKLFSDESKETLQRIKNFARYALYDTQAKIFNRLKKYYPENTRFVVLPMDMESMGAGKPYKDYTEQINKLINLRDRHPKNIIPLAFINAERDYTDYLYDPINLHRVHNFKGYKMYPALGYYPFDHRILKFLQYANDHGLPIMTHCSKGPVYYRGHKKRKWDAHPIFNKYGNELANANAERLPLLNKKNKIYSGYFGHPLNYHALLDKDLLHLYLRQNHISETYDLSRLKICLAHMGGADEIIKHFENLYQDYEGGLDYDSGTTTLDHNQRHQVWYSASWFRVILDLIKRYPENIYTDISYTLNHPHLIPFIKDIIHQEDISNNILFGTDFYMVSQERSEKEILYTYRGALGPELFQKIARDNVERWLG